MRKLILGLVLAVCASSAHAQTLSDKWLISQDQTFIARVQMGLIAGAVSIMGEPVATALHGQRIGLATAVLNDVNGFWARHFALTAAVDATVANQATQSGTVALTVNVTKCDAATPPVCTTTGNQAQQAALVTDAAINAALIASVNAFFQH